MGTGQELNREAVRVRLKKEVADVLLDAMENHGWRVFDAGHGVTIKCPCGTRDHRAVSVAHTPRDAKREANRVHRLMAAYPCWNQKKVD